MSYRGHDDNDSVERLRRALEPNSTELEDVGQARDAAKQVLRDASEGRVKLSWEQRENIERMVASQERLLKGRSGCCILVLLMVPIGAYSLVYVLT